MPAEHDVLEVLHQTSSILVQRVRGPEGRTWVVKRLGPQADPVSGRARLQYEYELLRVLKEAGAQYVVRPHRFVEQGAASFIELEDLGGASLRAFLPRQDFKLANLLHVAVHAAAALGHVHKARIVHKDVNPNNIIYNPATGGVQLIDFSIAARVPREVQAVDSLRSLEGTPAYLSPEQTGRMHRALDYRTDFYSLGVTLYEALGGGLPFAQTDLAELVHAILTQAPADLALRAPHVPAAVLAVVRKLMDKDQEQRYASAFGVQHDLQRCLSELQDTGQISAFVPGAVDPSETFTLPSRLYGRAQDVETLLNAFLQARAGGLHLLLVRGPSGIGKSVLVGEVVPLVVDSEGLFAAGKYDQLRRHVPFSAFSQAIAGVVRRLLMEPERSLKSWQRRLQATVGRVGQSLLDIVPTMERLIGPQQITPQLQPQENERRLLNLLVRFLQTLCEKQPLLLFLDDLQWADASTLKLLRLLATEGHLAGGLLLVCAYRSNEVPADHPFALTLSDLLANQVPVQSIDVQPLGRSDLQALLADTTHAEAAAVADLAQLVLDKTLGNPFFVREFLTHLEAQGLLDYDPARGTWRCDLPAVRAADVTDNVVALMGQKLRALPQATLQALRVGACLSGEFRLRDLAAVLQLSEPQAAGRLDAAVQEGFVLAIQGEARYAASTHAETVHDCVYKFAHDRIRQAAYESLDKDEAVRLHHRIGERLMAGLAPEDVAKWVFHVVDHLNTALPLIGSLKERWELVRLNCVGAQEAKRAAAYGVAIDCVQAALRALPTAVDEAWSIEHVLLRTLFLEHAEAAYLLGDVDLSQQILDQVLGQCADAMERAMVLYRRAMGLTARGLYHETVQVAGEALELIGVPFNWRRRGSVVRAVLRFRWVMRNRVVKDLLRQPDVTDARVALALQILAIIPNAAFLVNADAFALAVFTLSTLTARHGNSRATAIAFAMQSAALTMLGRYGEALHWAEVAHEALAARKDSLLGGGVVFLLGAWVDAAAVPPQELAERFLDGYMLALEGGDLNNAIWCLLSHLRAGSWSSLFKLQEELLEHRETIAKIKQPEVALSFVMMQQMAHCFAGHTDTPWTLSGPGYNEAQTLAYMAQGTNTRAAASFYSARTIILFLHQDPEAACEAAQKAIAGRVLRASPNAVRVVFALCAALAVLRAVALRGAWVPWQRQVFKAAYRALHDASSRPGPFTDGVMCLLRAELLGQRRGPQRVGHLYEQACAWLSAWDHAAFVGMAHECAAHYFARHHYPVAAAAHVRAAYAAFSAWGAPAKLRMLEEAHPGLGLGAAPSATRTVQVAHTAQHTVPTANTLTTTTGTNTGTTSSGQAAALVDLPALIRASQALSGEVATDKLLAKILDSVGVSAGATRAALFLLHDQDLQCVGDTAPGSSPVAEVLLRYVLRTQDMLVINSVQQRSDFRDVVFAEPVPRALACAPLVYQGKVKGAVYLENHLLEGGFSEARLAGVTLLASQAAVALEYADVFGRLEQVVEQRTRELNVAHQRLLDLDKRTTEVQMAGGFAHEMRNALSTASYALESCFPLSTDITDSSHRMVELALDRMQAVPGTGLAQEIQEVRSELKIQREAGEVIHAGVGRGLSITNQILAYAQVGELVPGDDSTPLQSLVSEILHDLQADLNKHGIDVQTSVPQDLALPIRREHGFVIMRNLIANARDALDSQEGVRRIVIEVTQDAQGTAVIVQDTGRGMSEHTRSRVFQPFFTTKGAKGTGLGLGLSRKLARVYGGDLTFSSAASGHAGMVFRWQLPRH